MEMVLEECYGIFCFFLFLRWFQMSAMASAYENAASVCIFCAGCGLLSAHAGGPPVLYIKRAPKFVLGFPPTPIWIKHYIDKLDVVLGLRLVGKTKQRQQDNKANAQQKKNVARRIFEQRCTLVIVSLSVREYRIEVRYGAI